MSTCVYHAIAEDGGSKLDFEGENPKLYFVVGIPIIVSHTIKPF
jgi:hypothetical protein